MKKTPFFLMPLLAGSLFILSACQQNAPVQSSVPKEIAGQTQSNTADPAAPKPVGSMTTSSVPITGTEQTIEQVNSYQMDITKDGFVPKELTIKVGTTVVFVNDDVAPHRPASGPHPVHTICPGLDALKNLNKGDTYQFTFTEAKVCPIHDHLNPSTTATITVVE